MLKFIINPDSRLPKSRWNRDGGQVSGKKLLLFGIVLLLTGTNLSAGIVVNSSTEHELNVSVTIPEMRLIEAAYPDGNIYSRLIVPLAGQLEIGKPDVPGFARWILIPNGTNVSISTFKGEPIVYENINLPPVQTPQMDSKGASEPPFTKDETIFSTNDDYPGIFAETENIKHKRGQALTILWIYPYQYNPVQKRLTVYPELEVTVHFSGTIETIPSNLRNENLEKNLKGMAINAEAVLSAEKQAENQWKNNRERTEGCELLIITHPDFEDAANTLAAWKIRRGIYTKVVNTTTTGSTTNLIENYIDNAYDTWDPAPSYLLFIGDAEFIPTWYVNMHPKVSQGHTGTDIFYADYNDPADYVPEFGYARLSVDTDAEADSLVARIIRYEKSPTDNSSYYTHTTMACCFQDGHSGSPPDSIADRRFAKTSEDVKIFFDANTSYIQQRIYTTYNGYNTDEVFPKYWNNESWAVFENDTAGEEIPVYLQKPTFPWDGDTGDITTAFNNGRFFVFHRDHGARNGWSNPEFYNWHVDALTNGEKRPFVWSINCQTGWFDNETDDAICGTDFGSECFVEHWLRHSTGGSCGLIGSTRNSYSGKNDRLVWGWMDAIWPNFTTWCNDPYGGADPIYKMGDVLNYGKEYMTTKYAWDSYVRTEVEEFHWFGDPTTEMWTSEPNELTYAEVTSSIDIGTTSITVEVTPATQGMLVAICSENADNLFGTAETNASGVATVTLNHAITMEGELYVTIIKHDYLPYEFLTGWNTWTGAFNYLWHNGNNWTLGHIPTASENVIITSDGYHPVKIGYLDEECNNLIIEPGATLWFYTEHDLIINGDMTVNGEVKMTDMDAQLTVYGDVSWESGSTVNVVDQTTMRIYGNWDFQSGANVHFDEGSVMFMGSSNKFIRSYEHNCYFNICGSYKTGGACIGVSILSTDTLNIHGSLYIHPDAEFNSYSSSPIVLKGQFYNNNHFHFTAGTFVFDGTTHSITSNTGDYFNNLTISSTGNTSLSSDLQINGNLLIEDGSLVTNNHIIEVGGNWTNSVGSAGFVEGTGRVVFNGISHQYVNSDETFNILEVDCGAALRINNASHTVTCSTYDWTSGGIDVLIGIFTALDLEDNGLYGSFYVNPGGTINLHQDVQLIDLNGTLWISGGTMNVYGGSTTSYWPFDANASITMSGGVLDFKNEGIFVSSYGAHTLTDSITGGIIRTVRSFTGNRSDFNPTGGTIELYGDTDADFGLVIGSNFYNVTVNKSSKAKTGSAKTKEEEYVIVEERDGSRTRYARANTVTVTSNLDINGDFLIDNGVFVAPDTMWVGGDWTNNVGDAGFLEGTRTVTFNGSDSTDITTDETFYNLTIDKTTFGWQDLEIIDGITIDVTNDLNITNGNIEMNNNSTLNIGNDLDIALNAGLNANYDTGLNITIGGDWTNNNTTYSSWIGFYPGTSTVTFNGSANQSLTTAVSIEDFYNLVLDISLGDFRSSDNIQVLGDLTISNGLWYDNISSLTHYVHGDFTVAAGAGWLGLMSLNTLVFKGTADQNVSFDPTTTIGCFHNVLVDKTAKAVKNSAPTGGELLVKTKEKDGSKAQTVTLISDCIAFGSGYLIVDFGILNLNGHYYRCTGNVTINNGGKIAIGDNAWLEVGGGGALNVNDGGVLELIGSAGNLAKLTHHSSYYYVEIGGGGTISAEYAIFEYMSTNGVNVKDGAIIDADHPFDNCIFRNGIAGGTLLTINNDQILTIANDNFPTNTWGGNWNVSKPLNQGHLTFTGANGDFAGPNYENDTWDLIDWSGFAPDLTITNVVWSDMNPYVCDMINVEVTVTNIGNADVTDLFFVDLYYNLPSPPGIGDYGDQIEYIPSGLPDGDSVVVHFYTISDTTSGNWSSYVQVDVDDNITESDEENNVWGPDAITWNGLPAIDNLTIQYNVGTNEIELNWTYSASADSFYIYRDTDPYFTPAYGTPYASIDGANTNWSEPASGTKYFYIVTAVKSCQSPPPVIMKNKEVRRVSKR